MDIQNCRTFIGQKLESDILKVTRNLMNSGLQCGIISGYCVLDILSRNTIIGFFIGRAKGGEYSRLPNRQK